MGGGYGWLKQHAVQTGFHTSKLVLHVIKQGFHVNGFLYIYFVMGRTNKADFSYPSNTIVKFYSFYRKNGFFEA
jgi:hypothetical protein